MKHFITTISLQLFDDKRPGLQPVLYRNPEKVDFLENDRSFTHPILVPMKNLAEKGEKTRISVILTNDPGGFCKHNYELFMKDLNQLRDEIGFDYGEINEIYVDYAESTAKHLDCFEKIIESINSDELITADVTYGNKPTAIAIQLALTFSYLYRENIAIKAMIYGEVDHSNKKIGSVFDVSALFYMNSLMARMTSVKPKDPLNFIKSLLNNGEEGEKDD